MPRCPITEKLDCGNENPSKLIAGCGEKCRRGWPIPVDKWKRIAKRCVAWNLPSILVQRVIAPSRRSWCGKAGCCNCGKWKRCGRCRRWRHCDRERSRSGLRQPLLEKLRSHPNKTRGATPSMADGADAPTPHSETTKYGTRSAIPYLHPRATRAYVSAPPARAAHVGHITRPLPSHTLGAHPTGREPAHVWLLARHLI